MIVSQNLDVDGRITADGNPPHANYGSGAGGCLNLEVCIGISFLFDIGSLISYL